MCKTKPNVMPMKKRKLKSEAEDNERALCKKAKTANFSCTKKRTKRKEPANHYRITEETAQAMNPQAVQNEPMPASRGTKEERTQKKLRVHPWLSWDDTRLCSKDDILEHTPELGGKELHALEKHLDNLLKMIVRRTDEDSVASADDQQREPQKEEQYSTVLALPVNSVDIKNKYQKM